LRSEVCDGDDESQVNSKPETLLPAVLHRVLEAFKQDALIRFDDFSRRVGGTLALMDTAATELQSEVSQSALRGVRIFNADEHVIDGQRH